MDLVIIHVCYLYLGRDKSIEMKTIRDKLQKLGFHTVVMTGSGSCFFCFGDVEDPILQDVQFFPFVSIQRNSVNWYS